MTLHLRGLMDLEKPAMVELERLDPAHVYAHPFDRGTGVLNGARGGIDDYKTVIQLS